MFTLATHSRPLKSFTYNRQKVFHPAWFQGNEKKTNYFEGWYFKNINAAEDHCWSFIPGVSLAEGDSHSFVQVIDGFTGNTWYYRFDAKEFCFSSQALEIRVGGNYFSDKKIILDLDDDIHTFKGEIAFNEIAQYPVSLRRPGIMGWYRYVPFMECYHGVVSLDHLLQGQLMHNETMIDFTAGRGYIEKDWGSSMPESWIWMQTNHFENPGTSFMMSIARIPWIGKTFTGFLGYLLHDGKLFSFATYTGARVTNLSYTEKSISLTVTGKQFIMEVQASKPDSYVQSKGLGGLKAPVLGNMNRVIHESVDSTIVVKAKDRSGNLIFSGTGRNAGFEMVGNLELLRH
jgi:tocopherol cyclase